MDKILAPIKYRVNIFIDTIGEDKSAFQDKTGVTLVNLRAKKSEFTGDKIANILAAYPQLSAEWLMRNEGEMLREPLNIDNSEQKGEIGANKIIKIKDNLLKILESDIVTKSALIDSIKKI